MTRILVAFVLALSLAACATLAVYTDHSPSAQFSSYRTYTWREKPAEGSPLMNQRIVDTINYQLRNKGWNEVPSGGDVSLAAHVTTRQEYDLDTYWGGPWGGPWGWGWGGWGWYDHWGWYGSYGSSHLRSYTVGTLVVDMYDEKTKQAIWRGTAEGTVRKNPAKHQADLQAALTQMFATFPPGSVATTTQ